MTAMDAFRSILCIALLVCTAAQEPILEQQTPAVDPNTKFLAPRRTWGEVERENFEGFSAFAPFLILLCCCSLQFIGYTRRTNRPAELDLTEVVGTPDMVAYGPTLKLSQLFSAVELCAIEAPNKYISDDGRLYIEERSDCLMRICCSVNRELTLYAHAGPSKESPSVLRMFKPMHLQGCCCCRPTLKVETALGESIGSVEDPFKCCTMDQQVLDKYGQLRYTVEGAVCQLGMCCPCCQDVDFEVMDASGREVGAITKPAIDCCEMLKMTNRFEIEFPVNCSVDDKSLLIGAAMLLDLEYFEAKKNND